MIPLRSVGESRGTHLTVPLMTHTDRKVCMCWQNKDNKILRWFGMMRLVLSNQVEKGIADVKY